MGTRYPPTIGEHTPEWTEPSLARSAESNVRQLFRQLLEAWGRGDGAAYGALFTEEADYVAFDGSHTRGREAIASSHQQLFGRWLKGTRLVGEIVSLKNLAEDVVLVHATGGTVFPEEEKPRPSRDSIQTLVAVKDANEWRFAAFHNTRILRRGKLGWIVFGIADRILRR